ncbi:MAG: glycosyltransferase [Chloroflexi bacterium]|nr:glycosyltransferase [Chloroflexota bacterium]
MGGHVTVVIVNWNGEGYLERCLSSLRQQTYADFEVLLVDNGSSDGSAALVRERFPEVRLLALERNAGFATGNNLGIRASQGAYVATLNNDTEAEPGWLAALVAGMEAAPRVGMCASKMLFFHQRERINSTGIAVDRLGIAWDRDGGRLDAGAGLALGEVFGPCAGAALYRRELLEETGGFDDGYFYLYEDVDLAWRARLLGWRAWYCPAARVYHVHAGAGTEGSPMKSYLLARNRIWTLIKDYPGPQWYVRLPLIWLYDLLAVGYSLLRRGDAQTLRGRLAGYAAFPRLWPQRVAIQRRRQVSWPALARQMAPLSGPFRVWRRFAHLSRRADRL